MCCHFFLTWHSSCSNLSPCICIQLSANTKAQKCSKVTKLYKKSDKALKTEKMLLPKGKSVKPKASKASSSQFVSATTCVLYV